jgi:hypothetical protein
MMTLREIEADCQRINRELDLEAQPGYRRHIGKRRPNPSIGARKSIDRFGHDPVSWGKCGLTSMLANAAGRYRVLWLPCGCLSCPTCGPRLRRERIALYLQLIGDTPVYAATIALGDWPRVYKQLQRAHAPYLRFQTRTGYLVLTTKPIGAQVTGLQAWLAEAFAQVPAGGRVSASQQWQLARQEHTPSGWTIVEVSEQPVEDVVAIAESLGVYAGGGMLIQADPARWDAFRLAAGFHAPDHHRWWTAAAA